MCRARATAPGVAKVFKLSSNETPLGPSPKAIAAYRAVGEHLEDYPDGAATALREAIGARLRARSRPHRLRRRLRRPAQSACARLSRGRRRGDLHHARLPGLSDRDARRRRQAGGRAGDELHRRRRRHPGGGDAEAPRSCSSPTRTIRPAPTCRSTRSSACTAACRRMCCWCSTRPMPNMSGATTTRPASNWSRPRENVVMMPHLLEDLRARRAAARLDVRRRRMSSTRINRIRGPFNVNAPAIAAGIAAIERHRACRAFARAQ